LDWWTGYPFGCQPGPPHLRDQQSEWSTSATSATVKAYQLELNGVRKFAMNGFTRSSKKSPTAECNRRVWWRNA
jgi:hypothetical protein